MKRILRACFLAVALGLLAWALVATWDEVLAALKQLTWAAVLVAFFSCVVALGLNAMSWRAVMHAVGLRAHVSEAFRVFFLSQVGKYVPGSIWPVVAQAEFARDHGVSRARAMTGSIVAMIVGVVTSGIIGAVGLVLSVPGAVGQYWWALVVAVLLACLLFPAVLDRLVSMAFRLTRRPDAPVRIGARPLLASAAWSAAMWLVLGVQAWVLLREMAPGTTFVLAAGAFAFAWLVGFLVVIAPAGVGAREAALILALSTVADPGEALSFALISRFVMTLADAAGFGVGVAIGGSRLRRDADRMRRSGAAGHAGGSEE
ncbi:MAG: hypothetical protein CMH34_02165 [Microbacterium sp.]|nr:hypothetical protein [Microbacterium sp.]